MCPGALVNTQKPQRAAAIARAIGFQLREQRAFHDEWLRNHDRALAELPSDATRYPLVLVLDNVRSAASLPSGRTRPLCWWFVEPRTLRLRCEGPLCLARRCGQHSESRRGGAGAARALLRL